MINRYSTLTMASKPVCRVIESEQAKYEAIDIKPWHHIVINGGQAFIYIWDTRIIEAVIPENCLLQDDLTYAVIDNGMDLIVPFDAEPQLKEKCMAQKEDMPIMFLGETLTDDERALLDINHY